MPPRAVEPEPVICPATLGAIGAEAILLPAVEPVMCPDAGRAANAGEAVAAVAAAVGAAVAAASVEVPVMCAVPLAGLEASAEPVRRVVVVAGRAARAEDESPAPVRCDVGRGAVDDEKPELRPLPDDRPEPSSVLGRPSPAVGRGAADEPVMCDVVLIEGFGSAEPVMWPRLGGGESSSSKSSESSSRMSPMQVQIGR
jgi:hypothetical protein